MKRCNATFGFGAILSVVVLVCSITQLTGCGLFTSAGGYAEPCEQKATGEWTALDAGPMYLRHPGGSITVGVAHADIKSRGLHVAVSAVGFKLNGGYSSVRAEFTPVAALVRIQGREVVASDALRPLDTRSTKEGCEFGPPTSVNLNRCGTVIVDFQTDAPFSSGFELHLGDLVVDGRPYKIPPIKFCYRQRTIETVPLHF